MTRASRWVLAAATLLLFTGIGLTAYTALQCVPMPIGWLAVIAPHNADVWSRALSPLHEPGPSWAHQQAKSTSALYRAIAGSAVTSCRPSAIAWAMSIRSTGSL